MWEHVRYISLGKEIREGSLEEKTAQLNFISKQSIKMLGQAEKTTDDKVLRCEKNLIYPGNFK